MPVIVQNGTPDSFQQSNPQRRQKTNSQQAYLSTSKIVVVLMSLCRRTKILHSQFKVIINVFRSLPVYFSPKLLFIISVLVFLEL